MFDSLLREKEDVFSVVGIVCALLPSPGLLLFVARPEIFERMDLVHLLLVLPGVGFGFLVACWFAGGIVRAARMSRADRIRRIDGEAIAPRETPKDWLMLSMSSAFSTMFLLLITVWAYWHPIRLGATLVLVSVMLLVGSALLCLLIYFWPIEYTDPPLARAMRRARAQESES